MKTIALGITESFAGNALASGCDTNVRFWDAVNMREHGEIVIEDLVPNSVD